MFEMQIPQLYKEDEVVKRLNTHTHTHGQAHTQLENNAAIPAESEIDGSFVTWQRSLVIFTAPRSRSSSFFLRVVTSRFFTIRSLHEVHHHHGARRP